MGDINYPLFPVFAFVGFFVGLIPFCWHLQAWNAATCAYMLWSSIASLIVFVNSIVWNGNIANPAPVWCDITTKFIIGAGVGIPASSLCINRRLYKIASVRAVSISYEEKRRSVIVDISISIGIPIMVMALHYIVQGHRYNIIEDIGCIATIFNTPPAYPLVYMWPVLLGCVSFVYAFLTLRSFWMRRLQFNELISATSSMTINRYFRLMLLSCLEMMLTIPLTSYSIYLNSHGRTLSPWISWSDAHFNFSFIETIPAVYWRSDKQYAIAVEMGRWIYPCSALLFFALFGFAEEARRNYRAGFSWLRRIVTLRGSNTNSLRGRSHLKGFVRDTKAQALASESTLPPYSPRKCLPKKTDSIFSSVISFPDGDLEKGLPSATSTLPTIISPSTTIIASHEDDFPSSPTDSFDEHTLPPPPAVYRPSPSPPYHRPFSPPSVMPVTPLTAEPTTPDSATPLRVLIHRESIQEF
ncbi:STE3-domain-containing protein [Trametopsis cervina]|nr:STE3-domain-containing protein [Trametopsis cervina]